jgi:hypothetical protein
VRAPSMVPVLFMPAVMAAEKVGAGREELEDFDEAADGEPVLRTVSRFLWRMREPLSRAAPTWWQATAPNFFGAADIAGGRGRGPRGPSRCVAAARVPAPAAAWR